MSIKRFLASRTFFIHLTIALLLAAVILFIILQSLKVYTRHGQSNPVPDFNGMIPVEALQVAQSNNLRIQVIDSVYTDKSRPGAVVEQVPEAGFPVKENRTIFLTINSTNKEQVALPKLINISFRQAQVLIENSGLQMGEISYEPSEYNDLVLQVLQDSAEVNQGELLYKGSRVDFIIGRDAENETTPLPNLLTNNIEDAKEILRENRLNLGVLLYDSSIETAEDSLNAIVWRQRPDTELNANVELGSSVDLWVTVDEEKINEIELELLEL